MSRVNRQEHAVRTRITLAVSTRMSCTNSPRGLGYILATSDFLLALERASPLASQAEGRGFETRRPLDSGCTGLHGFAASRRRIWLVEATNGLGSRRSQARRDRRQVALATSHPKPLATSWLHFSRLAAAPRPPPGLPPSRDCGSACRDRAGCCSSSRSGNPAGCDCYAPRVGAARAADESLYAQ
jgi:hypothetical protein